MNAMYRNEKPRPTWPSGAVHAVPALLTALCVLCVSAVQIAAAEGVIVKDDSGYAMLVVPAIHYVEMKHVRKELGRELELVEEDEFAKLFPDCEPGAVPPLGPAYQIETFVDEALTTLANVYLEAGDHEHLVHISGDAFKALLSGVRHGHYCHDK